MVDKKKIPEIHFQGFCMEWEERKLGKVYDFQYGQFNNNPNNGGQFPVYGANGIIGGYTSYNSENAVIIGHMGENAGSILWGEGKHFVTYNGTISAPKNKEINSKYGYYLLFKLNIKKLCGGSGQPFLSYETLQKIDVAFPSDIREQINIAQYFSNFDNLITQHQKRYDKLKNIKKAMLEKMFPQDGADEPEIRFKGFSGKWEKTTIGEIGSFYYGKSAPKWSLEENAPTNCVRYGELYTKFGATINKTYSKTNIKPEKLRFSKGGEILVPRVGEKPEDFGKCCCYLTLGNIAIGEMISVFETKQNSLFYTYYFRTLYKQFAKAVEGKNVKNLYYVELEPITIYLPSMLEQAKIGVYFQNLDKLIRINQQEIEKLMNIKKAMLEKMFV